MATEKRLIDANKFEVVALNDVSDEFVEGARFILEMIDTAPTVDAVEVIRIEEVKKEILKIIDEFIAEYRHISQSYVDHFGGKADAMETARRLVNAALTDLCSHGERREGE